MPHWKHVILCRYVQARREALQYHHEILIMNKMKKIRLTCVVLSAAVLAACGTTHNSAPVFDRPAGAKTSEAAKPAANRMPDIPRGDDDAEAI